MLLYQDVISLPDAKTIYEIPLLLKREGLGERVVSKLGLPAREADLSEWQQVVNAQKHPRQEVRIAMVGKYTDFADSYKSLNESLMHAGIQTHTHVQIVYVDAEILEQNGVGILSGMDAILVPGGFGSRGTEGMVLAVQYARETSHSIFRNLLRSADCHH